MPQKYKLPAGWEVMRNSAWAGPRLLGRRTKYIFADEHLVVRKVAGKWRLFHLGMDTGHDFATAQAAIAYAEDARFEA
jgi:hypothetical protein